MRKNTFIFVTKILNKLRVILKVFFILFSKDFTTKHLITKNLINNFKYSLVKENFNSKEVINILEFK